MQLHSTAPLAGIPVDLRGIRRVFPGPVAAVDGVDLHIAPGEFVAILGPSGCGKSTLLRIIAGLDEPDAGSIQTGPVETAHRHVGYVFQDAHLLPWRDVLHNVALPLELSGVPRAERLATAAQAIERVELADAMTRYPAQLSGGMRMRVSLARALITSPSLLLLDEPFAALDEITRQQLDEQLHSLWYERRMTVIFVTHSVIEATFLAQRAVVLTRRPARVILDHGIELPEARSAPLRTDPQFSQQMRVLFEALERGDGRHL
ncbi:MAG TPA: ABC transporter ATP-binding protein [Candidatus Binatia bacterium]|nr:ABC transporter ATP-binding protein [Candidatus Binatia bacterium]